MNIIAFECFFSSITDYFRCQKYISSEFLCVPKESFILMDSIRCKDKKIIEVKDEHFYFCFWFAISDIYSWIHNPEDVERIADEIQNSEFFTERPRKNYICDRKHLKVERGEYDWIKGTKYFWNSTTLVKYAHKHNLFDMKTLPEDVKERVIGCLNISDKAIKESKENYIRHGDVAPEYVTRYKDD